MIIRAPEERKRERSSTFYLAAAARRSSCARCGPLPSRKSDKRCSIAINSPSGGPLDVIPAECALAMVFDGASTYAFTRRL